MIHGYHLILPMYGFWLPNDPRGSWSEFIRKWELACFGQSTRTSERREVNELTESTYETGCQIAERHQLSVYDAIIVASALESECSTVWSEDEHNGLVIENRPKVKNPF